MTVEFDFQWMHLPIPNIEYTTKRVQKLLEYTKLPPSFFKDKLCLDAGCGNGRYTYAMQKLGAKVISFDISEEAVKLCRKVNPNAYIFDLNDLEPCPIYDFVWCWGVLHHLMNPRIGFQKVATQVKQGGILHIMVYHKETQRKYEYGRKVWRKLNVQEKIDLCYRMIEQYGGDLHGWWDALNPKYNWSFKPNQVKKWFVEEGFHKIKLTKKYNINMRGVKK